MTSPEAIPLGKYRGFDLELYFDSGKRTYCVTVKGETSRSVELGDDVHGNITRIDNGVERFIESLETAKSSLEDMKNQFETAQKEVAKPFVQEEELKVKLARLDELNILLNMDKKKMKLSAASLMRAKLLIREAQNLMNGKEEMQWIPIITNCFMKNAGRK